MPTLHIEKHIERPTEAVWSLLEDFGAIDAFNTAISKSQLLHGSVESGLGAERHCDLKDGKNWIRERVVDWQPGRSYSVEIYEGTMPIHSTRITLGVEPDGKGSNGFMNVDYTPKFGFLGRIMDAMMLRRMMRANMHTVLSGLAKKAEDGPSIDAKPSLQTA